MGGILAYNDGGWLRADTRLLMDRLALVVVEVGSRSKRAAAGHGTRSKVHRVLTRELALHVA